MLRQHLTFDELCAAATARSCHVELHAAGGGLTRLVVARRAFGKRQMLVERRLIADGAQSALDEAAAGCLAFLRGSVA